ncbi:MAG: hypothetical protein VKJ06_08315 [Vampirovibrionales bacterium]|nr:hypothetical protein [Vampirovibrionales bacterium]
MNDAASPATATDASQKPSHAQHFFREYWVLVFFGTLFMLTMGLPLIFSGFLSLYAFVFLALMLVGFSLALIFPAMFPVFMLIAVGVVAVMTPVWLTTNFLAYMALVIVALGLLFFSKFVVGSGKKSS